jgi:hypothetical protein
MGMAIDTAASSAAGNRKNMKPFMAILHGRLISSRWQQEIT